ncbi:hypothetical protein HYPGJ_30391 [Hyphomicrobium sp. GJ21]|nr:hypothetical protein HYPGJ_30391 [Hyphomicrobium sp. GJ21]
MYERMLLTRIFDTRAGEVPSHCRERERHNPNSDSANAVNGSVSSALLIVPECSSFERVIYF